MENLHYVVIFLAVVAIIFFVLSVRSRRDYDHGAASVQLAIAILLAIMTAILFLVMVNLNHLYEDEKESPFKIDNHKEYIKLAEK